jgi:hypothetical protein
LPCPLGLHSVCYSAMLSCEKIKREVTRVDVMDDERTLSFSVHLGACQLRPRRSLFMWVYSQTAVIMKVSRMNFTSTFLECGIRY